VFLTDVALTATEQAATGRYGRVPYFCLEFLTSDFDQKAGYLTLLLGFAQHV
jgi:hypothetical protein